MLPPIAVELDLNNISIAFLLRHLYKISPACGPGVSLSLLWQPQNYYHHLAIVLWSKDMPHLSSMATTESFSPFGILQYMHVRTVHRFFKAEEQ